jgi:hypothetical protein
MIQLLEETLRTYLTHAPIFAEKSSLEKCLGVISLNIFGGKSIGQGGSAAIALVNKLKGAPLLFR